MNRIINFHDVKDKQWFEKTILFLGMSHSFISSNDISEYYAGKKELSNSCHITVDDGDLTFYNNIFPVLSKHQIPCSIFVSPKIVEHGGLFWFQRLKDVNRSKLLQVVSEHTGIDKKQLNDFASHAILKCFSLQTIMTFIEQSIEGGLNGNQVDMNMNREQLLEVAESGIVEIGAHTLDHPILANETEEICKRQIIDSIKDLESILDREVSCFAFPNGIPVLDYGEREISILKESGVELSFTTEAGRFNAKNMPLSIPRFGLSYGGKLFVKSKFLFPKQWSQLRYLKNKDERKQRLAINALLDSRSRSNPIIAST